MRKQKHYNTNAKTENNLSEQNLTFDSRQHAFNVGIARDFSITVSLFVCHLAFWSEKNLANNKHIHDGLAWCYDTLSALGDYFPYMSKSQIETMIKNCIEAGLVTTGNYNKNGYDRTTWYALTPSAYFYFPHLMSEKYLKRLYSTISEKSEMDFGKFRNGFLRNRTTIPDTNPDTDPNCVGHASQPSTHTVNSTKKEKMKKDILADESIKKSFKDKFEGYELAIEQLYSECQAHYEQKHLMATKEKFKKWIALEKLENYKNKDLRKNKTDEEKSHDALIEEHKLYWSQFINDRDFLKIPSVQGKEPLNFTQWKDSKC